MGKPVPARRGEGEVSAGDFRQCLELVAADEEVDAMIALVLPTAATGDLTAAVREADVRVPFAVVTLSQAESVKLIARAHDQTRIPSYGYPEAAVAAMARAVRYGEWRAAPRGQIPALRGINAADARALVHRFLHREPDGGWLPPDDLAELLRCYGIPLARLTPVAGGDAAVDAAVAVGGPVGLKA